jgi:glycosyltransferase involved in cell wall biosynthesis
MRGFWADERIDGNIWSKNKFPYNKIYHFFKRKELEFINISDAIISLTHEGKREILSWEKATIIPSKISVIPTCADLAFFDYNKITENITQSIKEEFKLTENNFILTYLGSLGTWYMIEEMVDFYSAVKVVKPTSKFVIYTADDFGIVKEQIKIKELNPNDFIFKTLQRDEVPNYLSISDLSVSFIKPLYSKKASSPTKMGEILGMGIPMVCNGGVGDVEKIIIENNCGVIVNELSSYAYLTAIESLGDKKLEDKKQLRQASESVFSLEKGILDFLAVYNKILDDEK